MRALFHFEDPAPVHEPVHSDIPDVNGAELASVYYGRRMAGDFYDFIRVCPNRVLFGLLDVAGGLEDTRTIVSAAQHTFRTAGVELFSRKDLNEADAMMELCLQLNQAILKSANGVRSCPAFAGCYDESLGTVCYFNAGHTPGLVRDNTGVAELHATGLPLGLFSHSTCDCSTVVLQPGAVLLLVSRGIVEAKCGGEELGLAQVKAGFEHCDAENSKDFCLGVLNRVQEFMCTPPTHNDVTALALLRNDPARSVAVVTP